MTIAAAAVVVVVMLAVWGCGRNERKLSRLLSKQLWAGFRRRSRKGTAGDVPLSLDGNDRAETITRETRTGENEAKDY